MKFAPRKTRTATRSLTAILAGAFFVTEATAILMVSLEDYAGHKALAGSPTSRFTASIEVTTASGSKVRSSGIAIAPNIILVAAHGIPSATSTAVVTNVLMGSNVFSAEATSYSIRSWERYPGYVFGNYNTLDFGLIYLNEYISGFTPISFGAASLGQTLTFVGYGSFAEFYASTSQPTLGDRLAGFTPVDNYVGSPYPSSLYFFTFLSLNSPQGSLKVMSIGGDSGGPYFNGNGDFVGIATAATNGYDGGFGTALRTSNPDFQNYVNPRIAASWAEYYTQRKPELRQVSILASAANQPPKFSGTVVNGPPMGTARLQASLDLGTTDPWADLSSVPLDAEGSASFTNIPDSRPQALGALSDYFRVVTESPSIP